VPHLMRVSLPRCAAGGLWSAKVIDSSESGLNSGRPKMMHYTDTLRETCFAGDSDVAEVVVESIRNRKPLDLSTSKSTTATRDHVIS